MKLVIVESPAKAKTIEKFLGPDYRVEASYGHIRDLPSSAKEIPTAIRKKSWARLAVDTEDGFRPVYVVPQASKKRVQELRKILKNADEVILATDEDREGESISWHLLEVLEPDVPIRRIAFHEITRAAIQEALASPRDVNRPLVKAQEARRILDRLYGYSLSPVLWKKVRTKLSAGRVQSVALRLIVEREEERQRFRTSEYWDAKASLEWAEGAFTAALTRVGEKRVATGRHFDPVTGEPNATDDVVVLDETAARHIAASAAGILPWRVGSVDRKSTRQRPSPPFTTSTLQQAASNRLRMSPKKTMMVAQRLYEGIDLGGGEREGLITYMRTDSVTLSQKALSDAEAFIKATYGPEYHSEARVYKTKSKVAQEAHEGIRPSEISRTPEDVAPFLSKDELSLYRLIWSRTVACQMTDAQLDRTVVDMVVDIDGEPHVFRANGSILRFPGFLRVYGEQREDQILPQLEEGDAVGAQGTAAVLQGVEAEQHETRPPPRYTEASLVKKLEEEGIGRPSTYTPTISTIQDREYVQKRSGALVPTYVGMAVIRLLREHFGQYIDLRFTARMEDALDDIAAGQADSETFLDAFYNGEEGRLGLVRRIEESLPEIDFPTIPVGEDPETGQPIRVRIGKNYVFAERGQGDEADRATIPLDLLIDELTVEKAIELFEATSRADEPMGEDPETGLNVYAKVGPFGPYVQLGEAEEEKKPRRVSLPRGMSIDEVTLDYALKLLSLPREVGTDPDSGKPVTAGLGRYGPYVERARQYRSLKSVDDIFTVTLDEALALLAQKRGKTVLKVIGSHPESGAEIQLLDGRYGPYVTDGSVNASTPKGSDPLDTTVEQAVALLAEAAERKKTKKKSGRGRRKTAAAK